MKTFDQFLSEMATQATIFKSSQTKGATIDDSHADEPIINLNINDIVNYEMSSKMDAPSSQENMANMNAAIKSRQPLPPIYVRKSPNLQFKWMVVDGHHRYWAYKKAGITIVPARIIAPENLKFKSKYISQNDD